jgi:GcrA cell cycle regulator
VTTRKAKRTTAKSPIRSRPNDDQSGTAQAVPLIIHQPINAWPSRRALFIQENPIMWTDDRLQQLKTMWAEGLSASAIASRLGDTTRNAVIGKVHRLGLSGRAKTQRPRQSRRPVASPRPRRRAISVSRLQRAAIVEVTVESVLAELGPAPERPVTLDALTANTCHWPEGDPLIEGFHFCGRQHAMPGPYCGPHDWIAHQH